MDRILEVLENTIVIRAFNSESSFSPNGKKILIKESQSEYVSIWKEETCLYFQSKNEIQISVPKMSCTEVNSLPQYSIKKNTI